jgi:hypothetical protein
MTSPRRTPMIRNSPPTFFRGMTCQLNSPDWDAFDVLAKERNIAAGTLLRYVVEAIVARPSVLLDVLPARDRQA